jgi:hypothetical protein
MLRNQGDSVLNHQRNDETGDLLNEQVLNNEMIKYRKMKTTLIHDL